MLSATGRGNRTPGKFICGLSTSACSYIDRRPLAGAEQVLDQVQHLNNGFVLFPHASASFKTAYYT